MSLREAEVVLETLTLLHWEVLALHWALTKCQVYRDQAAPAHLGINTMILCSLCHQLLWRGLEEWHLEIRNGSSEVSLSLNLRGLEDLGGQRR